MAITINKLNDAEKDVDHIAAVATSTAATATDRKGNTKRTIAGAVATLLAFNPRGSWATATAYAIKDVVVVSGVAYAAPVAHTSGVWATDLAAGRWVVYQGLRSTQQAAASIDSPTPALLLDSGALVQSSETRDWLTVNAGGTALEPIHRQADLVKASGGTAPVRTSVGREVRYRGNSAAVSASGEWLGITAGTGQRAWYGEVNAGAPVTLLGAEVMFTAGSGGINGLAALMPWRSSVTAAAQTPPTGLHLSFSRWRWSAQYIATTNGPLVNIAGAAGLFSKPLDVDTAYTIEVMRVGDTVYLLLPDGSAAQFSHPNIEALKGNWAGFESYQVSGAVDDKVSFRRFWYSTEDMFARGKATLANRPRVLNKYYKKLSLAAEAIPGAATIVEPNASLAFTTRTGKARFKFGGWLTTSGAVVLLIVRVTSTSGTVVAEYFEYLAEGTIDQYVHFSMDIDNFESPGPQLFGQLQVEYRWRLSSGTASARARRAYMEVEELA